MSILRYAVVDQNNEGFLVKIDESKIIWFNLENFLKHAEVVGLVEDIRTLDPSRVIRLDTNNPKEARAMELLKRKSKL